MGEAFQIEQGCRRAYPTRQIPFCISGCFSYLSSGWATFPTSTSKEMFLNLWVAAPQQRLQYKPNARLLIYLKNPIFWISQKKKTGFW
jgi:hypothetical protein